MADLIPVGGTGAKDRSGDVIFVHGLDGDARSTWEFRGPNNTFWPEWLTHDLVGIAVWSLNYDAASLAWKGAAMPLVDRATNVLDLFETRGIGSKPLVFIAHSLGGLLVKQLLRHARDLNNPAWEPLATNTRGIVFFATPHAGSDATNWLEAFRVLLRPNDTIDDLRAHAPQLDDLNTWYRNNAAKMGIDTKVYRENQKYKGVMIVDRNSADPGITGVFPVALDFDHPAICKLKDRDQRYDGVLNFVSTKLELRTGSQLSAASSTDILRGLPTKWAAQVDAFLFEYLGIPGNRAPFVGREKEIQALTAWVRDESAPRYGLISARAGLGKSALLAHWVEALREDSAGYALLYFPISARWQTNSESAVFTSLAYRLAHLFGEPAPRTEDVGELRDVTRHYLNRAAEDSRRLLLVIDGLDEAAGWEAGTDFLPPRRRGEVRALVAARPVGEGSRNWLWRLGWNPLGAAKPFALDWLDRAAVAAVLLQMGNPLLSPADHPDIVEMLYEKSQGDPLVVGLYAKELKPYAEDPNTFKMRLAKHEPGVTGFFQFWFADQARLWGDDRLERETVVRALLSLCSLAKGPLHQEDVQGLNPELFPNSSTVEGAATDLARLIIGDGRKQGYVFSHPRLSEFVREEMLEERERSKCKERFLRYGTEVINQMTQVNREGLSEYVVRWHSTHLLDSGTTGRQFLPLLDGRWCAEWERVDGTPAGFLSDLDKAWQASRPDEVGVRIRVCLFRCSILAHGNIDEKLFGQCVASGVISPALAEVMARQQVTPELRCSYWLTLVRSVEDGRPRFLEEALAAARQIADEDARTKSLGAVVEYLSAEDRELLQEALAAARQSTSPSSRATALAAVATLLSSEDQKKALEEALVAAHQIRWGESRAPVLTAVAVRLTPEDRENVLQEALAAARQSTSPSSRATALAAVAAHLSSEDRKKALQEALAERITHCYAGYQATALTMVAERLNSEDRELLQKALAAARQIVHKEFRAIALSVVAARLPAEHQEKALQEALGEARQIANECDRATALSAVAARLPAEHQEKALKEALAIAQRIADEYFRAIALSEVAERLSPEDRELAQGALAAARQIAQEKFRAIALSAVAARLPAEDQEKALKEALAITQRIADEYFRAITLSKVAERLSPEDGERALQEALEAARQIAGKDTRATVLTEMAAHLGPEGREKALQEALAAGRQISSNDTRARVLSAVAERMGSEDRKKTLQEALAAARQPDNKYFRVSYLSAVVQCLHAADRESLQEVWLAARQIFHPDIRASVLGAVAERMGSEDQEKVLQEALEAARQMTGGYSAASLTDLVGLLSSEDREGVLQEAFRAARFIANEDSRAQALSAVAEHLNPEDRGKALQEALAAARQIAYPATRATALTKVAEHLDPEDREKALREALTAARKITNEDFRARALAEAAERLSPEDREKALQEALATARQCTTEDGRVKVLSAVLRYIELPVLVEVLQTSPALVERPEMLPIIERLARVWDNFCRLQGAAPADVFNSWLLRLAHGNRSHFMEVLRLLTPVIETIGRTAALRDMACAIADAGRWWP
jgi:hypothetical protein